VISPRELPTKIWNIVFNNVFLGAGSGEDAAKIQTIADEFRIAAENAAP
jgi:hypothetical protein